MKNADKEIFAEYGTFKLTRMSLGFGGNLENLKGTHFRGGHAHTQREPDQTWNGTQAPLVVKCQSKPLLVTVLNYRLLEELTSPSCEIQLRLSPPQAR